MHPPAPLSRRPHETLLRLAAPQLARLQRWMAAAAHETLADDSVRAGIPTLPAARSDRRGALRRQIGTTATLRLISPGGPGGVMDAAVVDVSQDGIALRLADPLRSGQSISLQIDAPDRPGTGLKLPPDHDREPPASEPPIRILAVVRYCRPEGGSYVLGCSFGADWAASLASEILPADMPALRKSA